ncbi:hypothetical protein OC846_002883 [Tilletia horrida]|uniref:Rab-GAP TBC domain-containing protein n=1 Tax=Tilletia horrida TaxID=155126 RepID=A0AAN6JSJ1_9BASI|nr:hypothetical protein OC845_002078 [Tilletia horrida]KAK0552479.1 hypothetical protein OC846_002883 [Tilletia horrida]KAK0561103.1 hypothetical protein OC861_005976 [Tilletia horrida]
MDPIDSSGPLTSPYAGSNVSTSVEEAAPDLPPPPPPPKQVSHSTKRVGGASSSNSRLQAYTSLLSASNLLPGHTVADLYSLRHLSIQGGVPDSPSWLRPQAWRVLLGYLPPEKREWQQTLASRRHEYAQFLVDFLKPLQGSEDFSERNVLLDQLYKDIIRSRKNGFSFYHSDVNFDTPRGELSQDDIRTQALGSRQALLHRLRAINPDYAAVTSFELGELPQKVVVPPAEDKSIERSVNTPIIVATAPSVNADSGTSVEMAPETLLPAPELGLVNVAEAGEPSFEALFDPPQHSTTPAGDAPAPFASEEAESISASLTPIANPVSLPPPEAVEGFPEEIEPNFQPVTITPAPSDFPSTLRDRRWHAILRILYIYALLNPSVGYIQGLNEVAFVIYWVMTHSQRSPTRAGTPTTPRQKPLAPDYMESKPRSDSTPAGLSPASPLPVAANQSDSQAMFEEPADELDLEADAFWCFSLLIGSVRELYEFDGIDHAVAGLRVRNSRNDGGGDTDPVGSQGQGWSRTETGMAGALRRLSLRLRWVDESLWAELRRSALDPRLPYYSFRWLACLLSNELALPSVVRLWDALLAEQDSSARSTSVRTTPVPGRANGLAESPKVEFLIDICAALLVRLRDPLLRPPPRSSRRSRARRQRTIRRRTSSGRPDDTDSDVPSLDEEDDEEQDLYEHAADVAQDDFAYKMHILQTFPDNLDLDVDVGPLLEQAYIFRQRRLAADLTGDGPPTTDDEDVDLIGGTAPTPTLQSISQKASTAWRDWRTRTTSGGDVSSPQTDHAAAKDLGLGTPSVRSPTGWFSSLGTRFASMPTPSSTSGEAPSPGPRRLGDSLQRYAEALQSSDAAANLSKASTNLTAKAMAMSASWNQGRQAPIDPDAPPASAPPWTDRSEGSKRNSTLGVAPTSLFAKARSISASYIGSGSDVDARRPSAADDSDSSMTRHPSRWSRTPIPNFPLPDPNDSDGRRDWSTPASQRINGARPQSPEGSEAGSESSSSRRMLPSLRMAAKLGLLPQDRMDAVSGARTAGPKPLMLSSSARPPRDHSARDRSDIGSDLETSRKVSSGPMAAGAALVNGASPSSSPRESIGSSDPRRGSRIFYTSQRHRGGRDSQAGSESGGEFQGLSSPPSEVGSDPSRRSSLTPVSIMTRGSISSTTAGQKSASIRTPNLDDYSPSLNSPNSGTVPASKFGRQGRVGHGTRESSVASVEGVPGGGIAPPTAWKQPISSSSDVALVRNVDASLRSRPRRRRQDTGSSLESTSVTTPTEQRQNTLTAADGATEPVRYQLTDEPVSNIPPAEEDTLKARPNSSSSSSTTSRSKFRSRVGSTRSLGSGAQSKRSSAQSMDDAGVGTSAPAGDGLATPGDGVKVGPTLVEHEEENPEEDQAFENSAGPTSSVTPTPGKPARRQSPANLERINTERNQDESQYLGSYTAYLTSPAGGVEGAMTPSPLPSPGPEAGMFVSADALLAELEGLNSNGRPIRGRQQPAESDWFSSTVSPDSLKGKRASKRLSEQDVPQGTLDAIGSALAQLEE